MAKAGANHKLAAATLARILKNWNRSREWRLDRRFRRDPGSPELLLRLVHHFSHSQERSPLSRKPTAKSCAFQVLYNSNTCRAHRAVGQFVPRNYYPRSRVKDGLSNIAARLYHAARDSCPLQIRIRVCLQADRNPSAYQPRLQALRSFFKYPGIIGPQPESSTKLKVIARAVFGSFRAQPKFSKLKSTPWSRNEVDPEPRRVYLSSIPAVPHRQSVCVRSRAGLNSSTRIGGSKRVSSNPCSRVGSFLRPRSPG